MALEAEQRAAYSQRAEEQSWRSLGRPLTPEDLVRVLERYR
jgi:hypothetical protein